MPFRGLTPNVHCGRFSRGDHVRNVAFSIEHLFDGEVYWALADNLGTVRTLLDNDGNRVRDLVFSSWGEKVEDTNPAIDFPFAFTGREFDKETGLYYYRARYYSPKLGRFISEDPLSFTAGDTNLSRYVFNSPTNFVDPAGEHPIILLLIGIGVIAGVTGVAYEFGEPMAVFVSGESTRSDRLDRQLRAVQLRQATQADDFAEGGLGEYRCLRYRLTNAEGELQAMAMVGVTWLASGQQFITPIGSLDEMARVGAMHHVDNPAGAIERMRRPGGGGRCVRMPVAAAGRPTVPAFKRGGKTSGVLRVGTTDTPLLSRRAGPAACMPKHSPGFDAITSAHVEGHVAR